MGLYTMDANATSEGCMTQQKRGTIVEILGTNLGSSWKFWQGCTGHTAIEKARGTYSTMQVVQIVCGSYTLYSKERGHNHTRSYYLMQVTVVVGGIFNKIWQGCTGRTMHQISQVLGVACSFYIFSRGYFPKFGALINLESFLKKN